MYGGTTRTTFASSIGAVTLLRFGVCCLARLTQQQGFNAITGLESGHPVIAHRYCSGNPDPSNRVDYVYRGNTYRIPTDVHVVSVPQCSLQSSTSIFSSSVGYAQSLATDTSVSVSATASVSAGKAFSAVASGSYSQSDSVKLASKMQTDFSQSLAVTNINCLVYKFDWIAPYLDANFGLARLHPDFETALNSIRTLDDAVNLVRKYGTHFYASGSLGGTLEQITTVSETVFDGRTTQEVAEAIDASASATVSGGGFFVKGSVSASGSYQDSTSTDQELLTKLSNNSESSTIISRGGSPFDFVNSDFSSWATSVDTLPVVVEYTLEEIKTILPDTTNQYGVNIHTIWQHAVMQVFDEADLYYEGEISNTLPNQYTLYIRTAPNTAYTADQIFGPYVYNFVREDGSLVFNQPSLFTRPGSSSPYFFQGNGNGVEFPVAIKNSNDLTDVVGIQIYSIKYYCNLLGITRDLTNQFATWQVDLWPVQEISLYDKAAGKQISFWGIDAINMPTPLFGGNPVQNPENSPDMVTLILIDRWFYEIQLHTDLTPDVFSPPISGLLQVLLDGQYDSFQYTAEYSQLTDIGATTDTEIVLRIPSTKDLTPIENITIVPFYIDNMFSFHISSVRLIDLNNYVYETDFRTPVTFGSIGALNLWDNVAYDSTGLNFAGSQDVLTVSVTPISDLQEPSIIYAYMLGGAQNGYVDWQTSFSICNKYGGVLASEAHMIDIMKASEISPQFCPYILGGAIIVPTGFYQGNATVNSFYMSCDPQKWYTISSTAAFAFCVGPYPSPFDISTTTMIAGPIALKVLFGDILLNTSAAYNVTGTNTSTTVSATPPPVCGAPTPTPPPGGYIIYDFTGTNNGYLRLVLSNVRNIVPSAITVGVYISDWKGIGAWTNATYGDIYSPYFSLSAAIQFPLQLRLSYAGVSLSDTVAMLPSAPVTGSVQF